jgi:hypothetical protein
MDGNERIIDEIRRYCDPYSILVFYGDKLIRLRCPFRVRVRMHYAGWEAGKILIVRKIMVTPRLEMVYIIDDQAHHFFLFQIFL